MLRRFHHFLREHPGPALDDEAAAFVKHLDTTEARVAFAVEVLARRGTEDSYSPIRVADYVLDLNHEHSILMRGTLMQEVAEMKLEIRQHAAAERHVAPDAIELDFGVDEKGPWYRAREIGKDEAPGPQVGS